MEGKMEALSTGRAIKRASVITPPIASQWYKSELCCKRDYNTANYLKNTKRASTLTNTWNRKRNKH